MAVDMNRPFAWDGRHWPSMAEFQWYLTSVWMGWAGMVVLHHTWKPVEADWRGPASMSGLRRHYLQVENGTWDSGPHLFLVKGAPDPHHDGIWMGTPLWRSGIAAGPCNRTGVMVEVVGDFDEQPWPPVLESLVYDVSAALVRKLKIQVTQGTVKGHRECLPNKSCPGNAIDMDEVREELRRRMAVPSAPAGPPGTYPVDQRFKDAWSGSGGIWRGSGLLAPGYARSVAYLRGVNWYQDFERGRARLRPDGRVEWLLLGEIPS